MLLLKIVIVIGKITILIVILKIVIVKKFSYKYVLKYTFDTWSR